MFEDLIKYDDLQEACSDIFGFSGVTFLRDFGEWKSGQKVDSLWFMLEKSIVEEQSDDGKVIKTAKFHLTIS